MITSGWTGGLAKNAWLGAGALRKRGNRAVGQWVSPAVGAMLVALVCAGGLPNDARAAESAAPWNFKVSPEKTPGPVVCARPTTIKGNNGDAAVRMCLKYYRSVGETYYYQGVLELTYHPRAPGGRDTFGAQSRSVQGSIGKTTGIHNCPSVTWTDAQKGWCYSPTIPFRGSDKLYGTGEVIDPAGRRHAVSSPVFQTIAPGRQPAPKQSCAVDEDQGSQRITAIYRYTTIPVFFTGDPSHPRNVKPDPSRGPEAHRVVEFGRLTFDASTCKKPAPGDWRVLRPIAVHPAWSESLDVTDRGSKRTVKVRSGYTLFGLGIEVRRPPKDSTALAIPVEGLACEARPGFFGKVGTLTGLPLPLPYGVSVIKYAISATARKLEGEGNTRCGRLGTSTLELSADSRGCVRVRADHGMRHSKFSSFGGSSMEYRPNAPEIRYEEARCKPRPPQRERGPQRIPR